MAVSAAEFLRRGVGKSPARVYLLHGKEEGQKSAVLRRLRDELVADEFDRAHLDAQEVDLSIILAEAMSIPAFSSRRVVFVRGVQHLKSADIESLVDVIVRLPYSTHLVLYTHAESDEEERKGTAVPAKLLNAVDKQGVVIECKPLTAAGFEGWLQAQLQAAGKEMTSDAIERFIFLTAGSTAVAQTEMEKVLLYVGDRPAIHREDVETVVSRTVEAQVFKLVDAIAEGDAASAMRLLQDVLVSGGRAEAVVPRLLALIARQFRLLWQMRLRIEYGAQCEQWFPAEPNLAQLLSRQRFLEHNLREQAQQLPLETLKAAFERLHTADRVMKGIDEGEHDPRKVIERLVIDLCRRK
jgi:DNA polymerase-3 subunit delta